jgi:hypothetical protein
MADVLLPDWVSLDFSERTYMTTLPAEAGTVGIKILRGEGGQTNGIEVFWSERTYVLDSTLYEDLDNLREPEITIPTELGGSSGNINEVTRVEGVSFLMEFGQGELLDLTVEGKNCSLTGCWQWVRNLVRYTVLVNGDTSREIIDAIGQDRAMIEYERELAAKIPRAE